MGYPAISPLYAAHRGRRLLERPSDPRGNRELPDVPHRVLGAVDEAADYCRRELRAPYGLGLLALIVTATPGTLWVAFDPARGVLTLHVLDLIDEDAWIRTIKQRYERYLLEIFE